MPQRHATHNAMDGFTLIEMSIVLVIIGLLVGGILVGRDLIRGAELRKTVGEAEKIIAAVNAFKTKFNCLPGDCATATDYFGTMAGALCPSLVGATFIAPAVIFNSTPGTATCNGDGDGRLDASETIYEIFTFWQQLGAANLIPGNYSGGIVGAAAFVPGINLPPVTGLATNAGWVVLDGDSCIEMNQQFGKPSLALIPEHVGTLLGAAYADSLGNAYNNLTPAEQFAVDTKYDDGSPVTGRIIEPISPVVPPEVATHCTNAPDETTQQLANAGALYLSHDATYKDQPECILTFTHLW